MGKSKMEEKFLTLITTEGKEITMEYKEDEDNCEVMEEIHQALINNELYWIDSDWITVKFGESSYIDELDFSKIIGIRYN